MSAGHCFCPPGCRLPSAAGAEESADRPCRNPPEGDFSERRLLAVPLDKGGAFLVERDAAGSFGGRRAAPAVSVFLPDMYAPARRRRKAPESFGEVLPGCAARCRHSGVHNGYTHCSPACKYFSASQDSRGHVGHFGSPHGPLQLSDPRGAQIGLQSS